MNNILVIAEPSMTQGLRSMFMGYAKKADLPCMQVRIVNTLTSGCNKKITKTRWGADPDKREKFLDKLKLAIKQYKPRTIMCNDRIAITYLTGKDFSCGVTRGSTYLINNIPCVVFDSFRLSTGGAKLKAVPHAGWLLLSDMKKAKRWHDGKERREPKFAYTLCDTVEQVEKFVASAMAARVISCDIETSGRSKSVTVTLFGYTILETSGRIHSYVIPMVRPKGKESTISSYQCHWNENDLARVLELLRTAHQTDAVKVLQNGSYDAHYYIFYRMPLKNYLFDTAVGFHSIWASVPKRIDFILSIASDYYRYWKDEGKEDLKDDANNTKLPKTMAGWDSYIRYNAQDCHFTLMAMVWELAVLEQMPWAMENFVTSMRATLGAALAMSYRGVKCSEKLQLAYERKHWNDSEQALQEMRVMAHEPEFNPNSPDQVATLIYDILQANPLPKKKKSGGRSTDEKALKIIQTQSVILDKVIDQIWKVKKPKNNISKYGTFGKRLTAAGNSTWNGLLLHKGRWRYKFNPCGTKFGRYNCTGSNFWDGTQVMNIPYEMRHMIEPDPGYVLFDFDYSKADFWHTAFASEDKDMMALVMNQDIDAHCYHASKFFQKDYDEVYEGYKNKEPWVVASLTGVRQNSKRIVYGANYLMGGYTLFMTMGKKAVDATALAMGHNITGWNIKDYATFCQSLINFYFTDLYPNLMPWLSATIAKVARGGNKAVCCGGRTFTFFENLMASNDAQRELASFYGQGGTASTINRALDDIYYNGWDDQDGHLLLQVHDSLIGQVREDRLDKLDDLVRRMEVTNTIHNREFVIPVEGSVGYGWGYRMTDYKSGITLNEIKAADDKWHNKNKDVTQYIN